MPKIHPVKLKSVELQDEAFGDSRTKIGSRTRISDGQCFYILGFEYEPEVASVVKEFFREIDPDFGQFGKCHHLDLDITMTSNISKTLGTFYSRRIILS